MHSAALRGLINVCDESSTGICAAARINLLICEPLVPGGEGALALDSVAFFFVADAAAEVVFQGRKEVEGDVGGLEALTFRVGDVVGERAVGGGARGGGGLDATGEGCGVAPGEQT